MHGTFSRVTLILVGMLVLGLCVAPATGAAADEDEAYLAYEVVVTEDGEISEFSVEVVIDDAIYEGMEAEWDGDVPSELAERFAMGQPALEEYSTDESDVEAGQLVQISFHDLAVDEDETIGVATDGETVSWWYTNVDDDVGEFDSASQSVIMPGAVTDSNADEVDENVATWDLQDEPPDELSVEAELAATDDSDTEEADGESSAEGDEAADSDDAADDDSLPAVGPVVALVAILLTARWIRRSA